MNVLLVGNYAPDRQYSMLQFSCLLKSGLREAGYAVKVIHPKARLGRWPKQTRSLKKWLGYADKFILFPVSLRSAASRADVVHICDHAYSLLTRYLEAISNVVTCHDLIAARASLSEFSGLHTRWSGRRYQRMIMGGLARSRHVVCDSAATAADVLRLCEISSRMVSVVYPALNFAYHRLPEAESIRRVKLMRIGDGERFVLHVGASAWYKNQTGLVRIFQRLITYSQTADLTLVMVCSGLSPSVKRLIEEGHLQSKVRVISDIEPEDLRALYSSATALLFPSVYEGFGWPIIEAQACGCPVFTSNRPPMTEVGGQGAIYFDPEDPSEAAQIILENLPHASRMREAGFSNVKRFSTANMIAGYLRAYREAITATSARRLNEIRAAEGFRGG